MCGKVLAVIIILIAVVLAALASFMPADKIDVVIATARFFDIMLPVLAVGGLIQYLCKRNKCACCKCPCCCKPGEKQSCHSEKPGSCS